MKTKGVNVHPGTLNRKQILLIAYDQIGDNNFVMRVSFYSKPN